MTAHHALTEHAQRVALLAAELGLAVPELRDVNLRRMLLERAELMGRVLTAREWRQAEVALASVSRQRAGLPVESRCSGCGAPVRWVRMSTGSTMPVDPLPYPLGNVVLEQSGRHGAVVGRVVRRRELPVMDEPAYRSHFATCPAAAEQRRRPRFHTVPAGPSCRVCGVPLHESIAGTETMHALCVPEQEWDGAWGSRRLSGRGRGGQR